MSTYATTRDPSFDDIRGTLGNLVQNFETDADAGRRQIRDLIANDRGNFCATSVEILKTSVDSPGAQYLVSLLVSNGMLIQALCNPELSREEALQLGIAARRVDPLIDVALARSLADRAAHASDPAKLMDVLCEIADTGRMMPSLLRLTRHHNPQVRSKAVKLIARGNRGAKWVMGRLSESDPRVRANAIESMWGADTPEARTLLKFAAGDANNRVVGNALLGQYHLGEASALMDIANLARHRSELFRASGAWVMGEACDPRFTDALRHLIADPEPMVRKRAFAALGQLKAANGQPPVGEKLHLAGRMLADDNLKGLRRLMLAVAGEDMRDQPKVAPLQFLLSEGGQYITSYKISEKPQPDSMNVSFVIPRSREAAGGAFFEGVLNCLKWKRPADSWCLLPYIETGDGDPPPPRDPEPPVFIGNADALASALRSTPKRLDCTDLWTAVWCATKPNNGQSRGRRHVIVLSSAEEGRTPDDLIANLHGMRAPVQVVASGPNVQLQEFCRLTHILFRSGGPEDVAAMIGQAYLNLLARYEIVYQPIATNASHLKVRVQTPGAWGEAVIAVPPEPQAPG